MRCIVKPETMIYWHLMGFCIFWRQKSRHKNGRPAASVEMRGLIRNIHADNPLWGPERIYDQLADLGFDPPSPNTIRKYLPEPGKGGGASTQTWRTFIANHMDVTWSMDLLVVPTITFRLLYVFIVLSHERRRIVQRAVCLWWLIGQELKARTALRFHRACQILATTRQVYLQ